MTKPVDPATPAQPVERELVDVDAMLAEANIPDPPNVTLKWRGDLWEFRNMWALPSSRLVAALELNVLEGARLIEDGFVGFAGDGDAPAEFPAVPLNTVPTFIQGWLDCSVREKVTPGE